MNVPRSEAGDTQKVAYSERRGLSFPPFSFSVRPLRQVATECLRPAKPVYEGMWCVGHVFLRADPRSSCGQRTRKAECSRKGQPLFWPGRALGGGARSAVAHKRISPQHKDSGPLLSLTRSTKEVTFVCLCGRRGCGRAGQGWGGQRGGGGGGRWHLWWCYNDRRGGRGENTRLTLFIWSSLFFHGAPLAPSNGLLQCLFTPCFPPIHTHRVPLMAPLAGAFQSNRDCHPPSG